MDEGKVHFLKAGMKVRIDPECKRTSRTYGVNDSMRSNFLGKECIVAESPSKGDNSVQIRDIHLKSQWCFHHSDVNPLNFNIDKKVAKPDVKSVIFDPDNL
jgi:hypothetical protein